jgi:hypothetical protein
VVASQDVAPSEAAGENARQVDLTPPPEADGEIFVTVADKSDPATPLVQRQFFREPIKRLNLRVAGADRTFQPGERVALDVDVLNEQDEPESALLGVRVWYDQAIPRQGEPATLVASVLGTETSGPLPAPTTLAAASNFYRFSQAAGAAGAAAPAPEPPSDRKRQRSYSGAIPTDESATLGDGEVVQPTVRTVSNRGEVRALYEQSVAHSAAVAAERKEWFGRVLLFGGLAVLVLLGLQALARLSARTAIWIPAATVAVASAVLGLAWLNPSWQVSVE